MNIQSIEDIYRIYLLLKDALKISARGIKENYINLFAQTEFFGLKYEEAKQKKELAQKDLEDLIVLYLFANFERQLRDEIIQKNEIIKNVLPSDFGKSLFERTSSEVEFWKPNDILDLFTTIIDSRIVGNLKQVKQYRDWIAHGKNLDNPPSAQIDPKTTYDLITKFINLYNV